MHFEAAFKIKVLKENNCKGAVDATEMTHFSVTLTSLARILLFSDAILDSASFDSGAKSDLQATGTALRNRGK